LQGIIGDREMEKIQCTEDEELNEKKLKNKGKVHYTGK